MRSGRDDAAEGFLRFTARLHSWLPGFLGRLIPRTLIGFTLINSCTFLFDLVLLALTHQVLGIWYPLAVTVSFGVATSIAFLLNKLLNFRARGHLAAQSGKYLVVLASNWLIWILGFSTLLEHLGVHYLVARVVAGLAEGLYIYLCSRFWVFRRRARQDVTTVTAYP